MEKNIKPDDLLRLMMAGDPRFEHDGAAVEKVLKDGADPKGADSNGASRAFYAVAKGYYEAASVLFNKGASTEFLLEDNGLTDEQKQAFDNYLSEQRGGLSSFSEDSVPV